MRTTSNHIHRFSKLTVVATFVLLVAGALVTSTGSGLAVPDWPLAFGQWFPPMVGGILYEHGHRILAASVATLTLILCLGVLLQEHRAWVRRLALIAFGTVCAQAVLGGVTVLWKLPPAVSIGHALLAELFFALTISLAIVTSPRWFQPDAYPLEKDDILPLKTLSIAALVMVYLQIALGAVVRHTGGGIAWHVIGALATLFFVGRLAYFLVAGYKDSPSLRRPGMATIHIVGVQMVLGVGSWITKIRSAGLPEPTAAKVWFSTAHLALGALLFGICVTLTWRIFRAATGKYGKYRDTIPIEKAQSGHVPVFPVTPVSSLLQSKILDFFATTKPRILLLVMVTTFVGFYIGSPTISIPVLLYTLVGTALVCASCNSLNQLLEREIDAKMKRTKLRPLPDGRLSPDEVLFFGCILGTSGLFILALLVNPLTAILGALSLGAYLFAYTPLKKKTSFCTLVGAAPGAAPILMGWTAAQGQIAPGGWILFGILYLWQLPHFLAIASIYEVDYRNAGLHVLPLESRHASNRQAVLYSIGLLAVSLLPSLLGMTGAVYIVGAFLLGVAFLGLGIGTMLQRWGITSRTVFLASVVYLPVLFGLMVLDKI